MTRYSQTERAALADLFLAVGPDAPTLCAGWTARDLAAHLVVRERRPDAVAGVVVPPLRGHGESVRQRIAAMPYPELVALTRDPPWWSPVSNPLLDGAFNTIEFFIHHEDVRRGRPGWQPRDLPADLATMLWSRLGLFARLRLRRFPARLTLQAPGYGEVSVGAGGAAARLVGMPGELLLFVAGRQRATRVQIDGPVPLAQRLRTTPLAM